MKNKIKQLFICVLVAFFVFCALPVSAQGKDTAQGFIDGIIDYNLKQSNAKSVQEWINTTLTKNAGKSSEWYVLGLSQSNEYDFKAYEKALLKYLAENEVYSASSRQKYALALIASGSCDTYIYNTLNDSIGKQGVMSWIYALHLLNNGYTANQFNISSVTESLISLQLPDGGWALRGTNGDTDITAMAIQSLAVHYKSNSKVKIAVDKALQLLSQNQLETGDYSSYGVTNPESTAQVITALSALGIDFLKDTRFIKGGNTLLDVIAAYCLENGGFCHQKGQGFSENATVQVFYALVSYQRMLQNKDNLYILDARNPQGLIIPETPIQSTPDTPYSEPQAPTDTQNSSTLNGNSQSNSGETSQPDTLAPEESNSHTSYENNSEGPSTVVKADNEKSPKKQNFKLFACLTVLALAIATIAFLYFRKKLNPRKLVLLLAVVVAACLAIILTDIQSVEEYYNDEGITAAETVGTVAFSIKCNTVADRLSMENIPESGIILEISEFPIKKDDTVHDLIIRAAKKHKLTLESDTSLGGTVYIKGINNLYEFDFGDLSGWVYRVNGETTSLACNEYPIKDGDTVEWLYSLDLGNDLE